MNASLTHPFHQHHVPYRSPFITIHHHSPHRTTHHHITHRYTPQTRYGHVCFLIRVKVSWCAPLRPLPPYLPARA
ncbi:hypothetical protein E2C01_056527 [Portunus trituberculatus]|uniref:Uncharacterized protein n=1 Tax=Portunus trituberculatus TaxID=210409 RepID=A0A5B7GUD5_PORTR|nr:hypothetical protein [Portunus trituberculatus]